MPRMVVFRVAGIISLTNRLTITHPFITIAGQSAPGDGVCVRGETTEFVIHQRQQFRSGARVALFGALQNTGDFTHGFMRRL